MGINTMMELAGFSFRKFRVGGTNCRKSRKTVRKRKNFRKLRKTAWKRKNLGELWGDRHRGTNPDFEVFFGSPPHCWKPWLVINHFDIHFLKRDTEVILQFGPTMTGMWAKLFFLYNVRYTTCQNPKTRMMYFEVFLVFETCLCT